MEITAQLYNKYCQDKCPGCDYDHLYWTPQQLKTPEGKLLDRWALVSSQCPKCKGYYHYEFEMAKIKLEKQVNGTVT